MELIVVTLAHPRGHPIATASRAMGLLMLLGVIFLASATGYVGPLHGPIDAMNLRRFQVLHYGVWPSLASALLSWWFFRRTVRAHSALGDDSSWLRKAVIFWRMAGSSSRAN